MEHTVRKKSDTMDNLKQDTGRDSVTAVSDTIAGLGNDEAESAARFNKWGQLFIRYLFSASKTAQVHDLNNQATQNVMVPLMHLLQGFMEIEGKLRVRALNEFLYINDVRIAVDAMNFGLVLYLVENMKSRKVEQINFVPDITVHELGAFLKLFFSEISSDDAFGELDHRIGAAGIEHVELMEWIERDRSLRTSEIEKREIRDESNRVFFRAVLFVGEVLKSIEQKRVVQVRKAERLVQQIFDILQVDNSILVGLTNIKNFDEYTFTHSVNVCILSMVMGERLNLHKGEVARLGVAALLHDIGKMHIPRSIINKPGRLSPQEWQLMKYHTMFGVKELSRIKSLREISDALFVSLQHHIQYNMNGYPQRPGGWDVPLFPRIVTIADYYDAMTTTRVYNRDPLTPDRALRFIFDKSGSVFDSLLVKFFIKAIGIYPSGTVVRLSSGEGAVVVGQNLNPRLMHRPIVVLLKDCNSGEFEEKRIDLAEKPADRSIYPYRIVGTIYDRAVEQQKSICFLTK